jgi:hypothetical protein
VLTVVVLVVVLVLFTRFPLGATESWPIDALASFTLDCNLEF